MKTTLSQVSIATLLALSTSVAIAADAASQQRYIVKYKTVTSVAGVASMPSKTHIQSSLKATGGEMILSLNNIGAAAFIGDEETVNALRTDPNVEYVERDVIRRLQSIYHDDSADLATEQVTSYAIYQAQANQLDLDMSNAKTVCVVDGGIAGSDGEEGGFNPDFEWANITGTNDPRTGQWNSDSGDHGTHVAGIVAAADNDIGTVGAAPSNPLHIVKVFNADGTGYSSQLVDAISQCQQGGAKIISMSFGGPDKSRSERVAFKAFKKSGGLAIASAGNLGDKTRDYPAGYNSVMMVGANDADNNIASFSQFPKCKKSWKKRDGNCVEVSAGGVNIVSTVPSDSTPVVSLNVDGHYYPALSMGNFGAVSGELYNMGIGDTVDAGAQGKVCLIQRGGLSFDDKASNCHASGGIGLIAYNTDGDLIKTDVSDTLATFPAALVTAQTGAELLGATNADISIELGDYGYKSGTSMSTPLVAGVAALVWSNHPNCSGEDIRDALKMTAQDFGKPGKDRYFGYGIVKARAASDYLSYFGCAGW